MRRRSRQTTDATQAEVVRARLRRLDTPARRKPDEPVAATRSQDTQPRDIGGWVPLERVGDGVRALDGQAGGTQKPRQAGSWLAGEWQLSRQHVVVIAAVLILGLGSAGLLYVSGRPDVEPITAITEATGTPMTGDDGDDGDEKAAPRGDPQDVVVHVTGLVNEPGIVTLPSGSRVVDAVEAAGGANDDADLGALNLARQVGDGEQIVVSDDQPPAQPPSEQQPTTINLNTATIEQLDTLPGIGPAIGNRIVEWRETHGYFTTVEELLEVSGIGERTFVDIEPLVTV
jgi:competence protein ComEA